MPTTLPDLMEVLPDRWWQGLLRWAGVTDESIAWMFEDEDTELPKETLRYEDQ